MPPKKLRPKFARRGKQVLFVGGTALYLKALLRGLVQRSAGRLGVAPRDLEEIARLNGPRVLHRRLREVDPVAAAKLASQRRAAHDPRTGSAANHRPADQQLATAIRNRPIWRTSVACLSSTGRASNSKSEFAGASTKCSPPVWSTKSETLQASHSTLSRTASQAVGYREALEHLQGLRDLPATIELVKLRTRQFAKRQLTWFRSLSECRWIPSANRSIRLRLPSKSQTLDDRGHEPFANWPVDLE